MSEIITLVVDIALGGLAYRLARINARDLGALKEEVRNLRAKVELLWLR